MKTLKSKITKQNRRRMRRRIVSILTAVVVFLTTYALVIPAITMDTETAAQEPGIEIAQLTPEAVVSEPAPVQAEPIAAEPVAAEPVAAEPVAQPAADPAAAGVDNAAVAAVDASAGVSDATGDSAVVEIADSTTPLAAPDATASSGQEGVTGTSAVADSSAASASSTVANPAAEGENATSEEENQDKNTETETDEKDKENEENEEEKKLAVSPLVYDNAEYTVKVSFGESAQIPDGTTLSWREFAAGTTEYGASRMILNNKMKENGIAEEDLEEAISSNRFFEVLFIDKNGAQFLPMDTVDVLVEYKDAANANVNNQVPAQGGSLYAVTFRTDDGQPTKANLITTNAKDGSAGLEAAGGFIRCLRVQDFPVNDYHTNAVIGQVVVKDINAEEPEIVTTLDDEKEEEILTTQYLTADGEAYNITLTCGPEAGIPDGVELAVSEIVQASDTYEEYVSQTENALDPAEKVVFARFFDIKIMKDGMEIQPNGAVNVKIELADTLTEEVKVVHFEHNDAQAAAEAIDTPVVLDSARVEAEALENAVGFETESFSVFGVVETETVTVPFTASDGSTYEVTVNFGKDSGIPEGAQLSVSEVTEESSKYGNYVEQAAEAIDTRVSDLQYIKLLDISIVDIMGNKVTLNDSVDVQIKLLDKEQAEKSTQVIHFEGINESPVVIDSSVVGDAVSFSTNGFSIYAVVDSGDTGDNARMTLEFYNGTTLIDSMYVKNSDILLGDGERNPANQYIEDIIYDPGVGTVTSGHIFKGWIKDKANYTVADADNALTIADIRQWAADYPITENETVKFYALIYTSMKIDYRDEDDISLGTDNILLPASETSSTYTVQHSYTPKDDLHHFEGWKVKEGSSNIQGYTEGAIYENGTPITITGDVTFSVNAPLGHWLIFHEDGGTYIAPKFIKSGEDTVAPTEAMTKLGYSFSGWFADEELTTPFNFGSPINDRTHVYAKWNANRTAPYTVVIWKQNLDATDYDFEEAITLTGTSNSTITSVTQQGNGNSAYARVNGVNKIYDGFYLKKFDQNKTVTPEGSTIVNVYYDRIEYTLRFFYARTYTYNNRTYVQVNCNNEGFLQGRRNNRNLNASLTYRSTTYGDYQRESGTNTWKDVNNNSINGNPLNLVSLDFLAKEGVSTGTVNINNVSTDVYTLGNWGQRYRNNRTVNTTYYYIDVKVRYEQSLDSLWPVPNSTFISQTMTNYNDATDTGNYTTISPLLQGSWATGNNIGGKYSTMNSELFVGNDNTAYFLTYWRFENHYEYQYNVYFSALPGETGGVTYNGNRYILQSDKSYVVANGQGWGSGADTDSGNGYWDVGTVTFDGTNKVGRVDNQQQRTINVYYDRIQRNIEYFDGIYVDGNGNEIKNESEELLHTAGPILYGANISSYNEGGADYYTPVAPEGYVFEGWYADSAGLQPYTFASTMPMKDIKVYAKWRQIQYRVFLHPNAGTDASLDWGSDDQAMNFRRSYGDTISLPQGLRSGYEMVGWFTDEACTVPFDSALVLNDTTVTAAYDKTVDMTDTMDKWGNGATTNADVNRYWITKKFDLYAKWRKVIDGALGIGIVYDANGGTNAPTDTSLYLDTAEATAQNASTPPEGKKFEYWVIQRWDAGQNKYVDTEDKIYPGDTYIVLLDNAKQVISSWENPNDPTDISTTQDATHTKIHEAIYTVQLRAEYMEAEQETPTHIDWFANNGTGASVSDSKNGKLKINEPVAIRPANTFSYPGHKFLGWARVEDDEDGEHPDHPEFDEDDLWLIYDENTNTFKVKQDGTTELRTVSQIAADERQPYHDLYAVWETRTYKVTIKKVVEGIETDDNFIIGYTFDASLDSGNVTLSNNDTEELTVDVPYGTTITLSENVTGYDKSFSAVRTTSDDGKQLDKPVPVAETSEGSGAFKVEGNTTITVTNTIQKGTLQINKTTNPAGIADAKKYKVSVENSVGQYLQDAANISFGTDIKWFEISVNSGITIPNLPVGVYTVTESAAETGLDGYRYDENELTYTVDGTAADAASVTKDKTTITTITNKYTKLVDVTVRKILIDEYAEEENQSFTFTPLLTENDADVTSSYITGLDSGKFTLTPSKKDNQLVAEVVFPNIPVGSSLKITETSDAAYSTEVSVGGAEATTGSEGILNVGTQDNTIIFTNTRKTFIVDFKKTALDGTTGLDGAKFTLTRSNGTTYVTYPDGELILGTGQMTLVAGDYELTESKAPSGYIILNNKVRFSVSQEGVLSAPTNEDGVADNNLAVKQDPVSAKSIGTIVVKNTPGKELPMTGGSGTLPYTLGGIALVGAAALMYGFRMRRRERRSC